MAKAPDAKFPHDDSTLYYVPTENRFELTRFERESDAEIACGLLRANGIPCELTDMVAPIMPGVTILWVRKPDAKIAWDLLNNSGHKLNLKKHPKGSGSIRRSA